jgi:hypothetical protein
MPVPRPPFLALMWVSLVGKLRCEIREVGNGRCKLVIGNISIVGVGSIGRIGLTTKNKCSYVAC